MGDHKSDASVSRNKRSVYFLLVVLAILIIPLPVFYFLIKVRSIIPLLLIWCLTLIDIVLLAILTRKYYNWIFLFLLIIITGFYLRSQRDPWEPFLIAGFGGLICISFYSAYLFLKNYGNNVFLKYIGFSSSMVLSFVFAGMLWKTMHWTLAGIFFNGAMILFIPFLFAFVFTLPGSNYVNWSKSERTIFFRTIIIPMIFVYILCVFMFVLSDIWTSLSRARIIPFGMFRIDLLEKPGLLILIR